jgi:thiamine-monophosphate kinase
MAGEFALIERLLGQPLEPGLPSTAAPDAPIENGVLLGPGDDCALVVPPTPGEAWAISTDMLVEGTHFLATDDPASLGWKTLAVNLSDLAAMGARPRFATLGMAIPPTDNDTGWIDRFFVGFKECAERFSVQLIGGDTTRGPRNFCVTILGTVHPAQALRRSGAQPGDDLWISGTPGMAALGLQHKLQRLKLPDALQASASRALHRPQPRVALGQALAEQSLAHSCLDVSDGILQDLGHITAASGLSATIMAAALPGSPIGIMDAIWQDCLLGGGDDYELLFTAPPSARPALQTLSHQLDVPLHRIGCMQAHDKAGTIQLIDEYQHPMDLASIRSGFDHFA